MTDVTAKFKSLIDAEKSALLRLEDELRDLQCLAHETHLLIGKVVEAVRSAPGNDQDLSARVVTQLMHRTSNDLRCASMLADGGYPAQSATVCTSLFEAALAAADIAGNDQRAKDWLSHENPTRSYKNTKQMIVDVLGEGREGDVELLYGVYGNLCMPKHVNPMHEALLGVEARDGSLFLTNGPDTTEFAINTSWFALVNACRCVGITFGRVVATLAPRAQSELTPDFVAVLEKCRELGDRAVKRWGA